MHTHVLPRKASPWQNMSSHAKEMNKYQYTYILGPRYKYTHIYIYYVSVSRLPLVKVVLLEYLCYSG